MRNQIPQYGLRKFATRLGTLALAMLLWMTTAAGQRNVVLEGSAIGATGKRIELRGYSDMLSRCEVLLDSATIDSMGHFTLGCYVTYPHEVFLQVERYRQGFVAYPAMRWNVTIPPFDWNQDETRNVLLDRVALPLEVENISAGDINVALTALERDIDSVVAHADRRHPRQLARRIDSLFSAHRTTADDTLFFSRYCDSRRAQLLLALGTTTRQRLAARYIDNRPILYHDENYMSLFFAIYSHLISDGTRKVPVEKVVDLVDSGNMAALSDALGAEPLLANEQIRELALLQALSEAYHNRIYPQEKVAAMVHHMADETKFNPHRTLASALLASWKKVDTIPPFSLVDADGNHLNLDRWHGKRVLLCFVRAGDPHSLREMETLAFLRDTIATIHPDLAIVSVACDRQFQKMYHLLRTSRKAGRYPWTWLHFDGRYDMLEYYGVVSYPTFVLLDTEGRVVNPYAPLPSKGWLLGDF